MNLSLHILSLFLLNAAGLARAKIFKWPSSYSLEATRTSIISGIVENYAAWIRKDMSRVDYNNGAVKTIIRGDVDKYGTQYEIHPETDEDSDNYMQCYYKKGDEYNELEPSDFLPSPDDNEYEYVGTEKVNDKSASKFVAKTVDLASDTTHTVWAINKPSAKAWIPLRYQVQEYSVWNGGLIKYEIWDYFNVNTDKKQIKKRNFNIYDKYECIEKEDDEDDETVIKELDLIDPENEEHVNRVFKAFKSKYDRKYAHNKEHTMRRSIFKQNLRLVASTNYKNLGYKLAINHFADRTPEEMKRYRGLQRRPEGKGGKIPFPYTEAKLKEIENEVPDEYDARMYGLVSKVKDQDDCGSCWTFGTTAAAEGALARSNGGKLVSLSNQALIDCAWSFGASGCDGGTDNAAYEWMEEFGMPTEAEYGPYVNRDGICNIRNMTKTYQIKGYTDVTPNSVGALKVALVNHGPLSVSVNVQTAFSLYSGGIFYDPMCNPKELNHEVTLVGYGEKDGETFWIIRNSWGPHWGIDGYMHISSRDNACGVTVEPTYIVF